MPQLTNPSETTSDRIKLPFSFDIDEMLKEVQALNLPPFVYYHVLQLRGPAHIVDPSLPSPPPAEDYADGSWCEWLDTDSLKNSPYLKSIVDTFHLLSKVTLVRLLRLEPGAVVKEHTDPTLGLEVEKSVIRLTIPILVEEGVAFYLNGEPVPMQPGECWYLRLTDPHSVVNNSQNERINMSIDLIPNEKVRALISGV